MDAGMRSVRRLLAGQFIPAIMQLFCFPEPNFTTLFWSEIGIFVRNALPLPKRLIFNFLVCSFASCMNIYLFSYFQSLGSNFFQIYMLKQTGTVQTC